MNSKNKIPPYPAAALLVYVIILTFPDLIIKTRFDADYSWYVGLHKAAQEGFVFGKDIVFTYGPLGFLTVPILIDTTTWLYSALYTLGVYAMFVFACCLFIKKEKASFLKTIIFAILFIAVFKGLLIRPGNDFNLQLAIFIFTYLYIRSEGNLISLCAIAFLYSVLPFIKFSSVPAGGLAGAIFIIILLFYKRRKEAAVFLITSFVLFCILGLLLIGPPSAIYKYLYGSWQIASGYSDAMGVNGPEDLMDTALFAAIFGWISYFILFFYCAIRKRRDDLIYLILSFGLFFLNFKLGFVRSDLEHIVFFFSMWLIGFGLLYLKSFKDTKVIKYFVPSVIAVMFGISCTKAISLKNLYFPNDFADKLNNIRLSFNLFRGIGAEQQIATAKKEIQQVFYLHPLTVQYLTGHTMDVFPCDIAAVEGYGFKWDPRPVFQSYSAYTPYLDQLNAKHFLSDSAPEYILYLLESPDRRYAVFDEPATFRILLQKYKPIGVDEDAVVLRKLPIADVNTIKLPAKTTAKFKDIIPIPKDVNGLIFAKIHIDYSFIGLISKFLYKPPNVYLEFFRNGWFLNKAMYRFIFSNSDDGVLVSEYITDQNDLLELWKGNVKHNVDEIGFSTECPIFYKNINLEFFTIPAIKQIKQH